MLRSSFKITEAGWRNNSTVAYFCYEIDRDGKKYNLEETINFSLAIPRCSERESLLRALHIALSMSYYKTFVPPVIEHPYEMTEIEASFWNIVYKHGLGEFLYKNQLKPDTLAEFKLQGGKKLPTIENIELDESAVLGIGGGKDSIVAGELLSDLNIPFNGFVMATGEQLGQTKAVASTMNVDLLVVNRQIDLQILEMNSEDGAYNGHIPISLIFGLVGSMLAIGKYSRYVVVGNEASASIPHVVYEGSEVNHQWSKSIEFERLFQDYLNSYVSPKLKYFSAIRPLSSVAVARRFANYPDYFEVFTSDNSLFKINQDEREHPRWSPESSKSLSSFILLAPWLSEEDLLRVFGRNFLDQSSLSDSFKALLGFTDSPILDCVGTPDELRSCLKTIVDQQKFSESYLVNLAVSENMLNDTDAIGNLLILGEDAFPESLANELKLKLGEK